MPLSREQLDVLDLFVNKAQAELVSYRESRTRKYFDPWRDMNEGWKFSPLIFIVVGPLVLTVGSVVLTAFNAVFAPNFWRNNELSRKRIALADETLKDIQEIRKRCEPLSPPPAYTSASSLAASESVASSASQVKLSPPDTLAEAKKRIQDCLREADRKNISLNTEYGKSHYSGTAAKKVHFWERSIFKSGFLGVLQKLFGFAEELSPSQSVDRLTQGQKC